MTMAMKNKHIDHDNFIRIAEELGWKVNDELDDMFELERWTDSTDEDYSFSIPKDTEVLSANLAEFADEFDIDEHIEPLVEIRGTHGIPKEISKLLESAEEIKAELNRLADAVLAFEKNLTNSVRDWYLATFPDDELAQKISKTLTWKGLWEVLCTPCKDVYDAIGVGDSLVRERIFSELANRLGVDYDVVYYTWLDRTYKALSKLTLKES